MGGAKFCDQYWCFTCFHCFSIGPTGCSGAARFYAPSLAAARLAVILRFDYFPKFIDRQKWPSSMNNSVTIRTNRGKIRYFHDGFFRQFRNWYIMVSLNKILPINPILFKKGKFTDRAFHVPITNTFPVLFRISNELLLTFFC